MVYHCLDGYYIDGEAVIECIETGKWQFVAPKCLPVNCSDNSELVNGYVQGFQSFCLN